jgi:hypothetical protein
MVAKLEECLAKSNNLVNHGAYSCSKAVDEKCSKVDSAIFCKNLNVGARRNK